MEYPQIIHFYRMFHEINHPYGNHHIWWPRFLPGYCRWHGRRDAAHRNLAICGEILGRIRTKNHPQLLDSLSNPLVCLLFYMEHCHHQQRMNFWSTTKGWPWNIHPKMSVFAGYLAPLIRWGSTVVDLFRGTEHPFISLFEAHQGCRILVNVLEGSSWFTRRSQKRVCLEIGYTVYRQICKFLGKIGDKPVTSTSISRCCYARVSTRHLFRQGSHHPRRKSSPTTRVGTKVGTNEMELGSKLSELVQGKMCRKRLYFAVSYRFSLKQNDTMFSLQQYDTRWSTYPWLHMNSPECLPASVCWSCWMQGQALVVGAQIEGHC